MLDSVMCDFCGNEYPEEISGIPISYCPFCGVELDSVAEREYEPDEAWVGREAQA